MGLTGNVIKVRIVGDDSDLQRATASSARSTGALGGKMAKFGRLAAAGLLAVGVGAALLGKKSVELEAEFSKTMNVLQATTGASGEQMKVLSELALKMGADTVFSANDAGKAMLELARGGISEAEIRAGALKGTLTLAAAGELEMGEAANIAVKSMGQFNLSGKDMGKVAAALAGGANASSASVRDMSMALAQGGLAANSVGFSIQETTAALAAFSNAGLEGSDAGTSMKTFLDRLVPATERAEVALEDLGVITADGTNRFIKANGEYKSAAQVAELLRQGTERLSASERKRLITQAFGSDAQRAATIFAKEGAEGMRELTKATSDTAAAQKMAAANMKGTAGAIESFKGSIETLMLRIGILLKPAVIKGLRFLTAGVNALGERLSGAGKSAGPLGRWFKSELMPALTKMGKDLVPTFQQAWVDTKKAFVDARPFLELVGRFIVSTLIPGIGQLAKVLIPIMIRQWRITAAVLGLVAKQVRFLWNGAFQPVLKAIVEGIARTMMFWGKLLQLIGRVPGYGWVGNLGDKLVATGNSAHALSAAIVRIPNFHSTDVRVNTSQATAAINGLWRGLSSLTNNAWTAVVNVAHQSTGRRPGNNAGGTRDWRGGWTWVGERGAELVNLPQHSQVLPHGESMALAARAAGGGGDDRPILVKLYLDGKQIQESLVRRKRLVGRDLGIA